MPSPSPPASISAVAGPPATAPAAAAQTPVTAATALASPRIELPSSDADYLNNPPPAYPSLSMRMGEQGKVVVRVLIGADGVPQKAELHTSSGFLRLDRAAMDTAMKWRYSPGKRGGVAETMWFNVPIKFVIS
jgi:protein TonB